MRVLTLTSAVLLIACLSYVPVALADGRYSSMVNSLQPIVAGVDVSVVGADSQLRLANRSGRTVTVIGYEGDQVGRVLGDRTVQVNLASSSYWINQERMGGVVPPSSARKGAAPRWKTVDRTGVLLWHDHRMHWMGRGVPPTVRDRSKRTLVWDYRIPLRVGAEPVTVNGSLWWVGEGSGVPAGAIESLVVIGLLVAGTVLVVRRRRRKSEL